VSQRANLALFLVSLFLIVTPDIAALVTQAAFGDILSSPGAQAGSLSRVLFWPDLVFWRITRPACAALASDPTLIGPFCGSFTGLTIALAFVGISVAAIIALISAPRRPRDATDPGPSSRGWIERACGAAVVLFTVPKVMLMSLAYSGSHGMLEGMSAIFCGRFFATGPFLVAETCALPMAMYFYLSAAMLVLAVAWWTAYTISMLRLAFTPTLPR
jgi:hypothetical protein